MIWQDIDLFLLFMSLAELCTLCSPKMVMGRNPHFWWLHQLSRIASSPVIQWQWRQLPVDVTCSWTWNPTRTEFWYFAGAKWRGRQHAEIWTGAMSCLEPLISA
jgi:hypothetical protein